MCRVLIDEDDAIVVFEHEVHAPELQQRRHRDRRVDRRRRIFATIVRRCGQYDIGVAHSGGGLDRFLGKESFGPRRYAQRRRVHRVDIVLPCRRGSRCPGTPSDAGAGVEQTKGTANRILDGPLGRPPIAQAHFRLGRVHVHVDIAGRHV